MKVKAKKPIESAPAFTVSHCNFTNEAPRINDDLLSAIRCVAEAATANAKAIEKIADRLWGPTDHRVALQLGGTQPPKDQVLRNDR